MYKLFKFIKLGLMIVWGWIWFSAYKRMGFNLITLWILCGVPFGFFRMGKILVIRNGSIVESLLILLLNTMVGCFIGGFAFILDFIKTVIEFVPRNKIV